MPVADDEATYKRRLGAVITELRLARGYDTQAAFAAVLAVHESTVQRWETGKTLPNAWDIGLLARVLDVPPELLIHPPDRLPEDVLDVSRAAAATVRREIVKRAGRRRGRPSG
jgi:transcriptional regulator with XRE-family HTH domain